MNQSLTMHQYVLAALHQAKGRYTKIADETGVPISTLRKIANGEIVDPGVSHIQKLHDYFRAAEAHAA